MNEGLFLIIFLLDNFTQASGSKVTITSVLFKDVGSDQTVFSTPGRGRHARRKVSQIWTGSAVTSAGLPYMEFQSAGLCTEKMATKNKIKGS